MRLLELLRKGLGFLLMSMGVSRPGVKKPAAENAAKSSTGQQ